MSNSKNTLLISETTLKDNSFISSNVDMAILTPTIRLVQDMHLQPIMGTKLYREVQSQVHSGSIEARITTLLDDFIEHILIHGTVSNAVYDLSYKFGNLTVAKNDGDNETTPSIDELNFISKRHKDNMQFYLSRLNDYLRENQVSYPEFNQNVEDDIRPSRNPYYGNIYTGNRLEEQFKDKLPAPYRYEDDVKGR